MKRNLLLGITFAIFSTIMVGCNDNDSPIPEGYTRINFSADIPSVIGERAYYGEGDAVTKLSYAAYDATTGQLRIDKVKDVDIEGGMANFTIDLPKGFQYDFVFWADAPESPYTFDAENHKVTVNYSDASANDESRDAFYGSLKGIVVNSAMKVNVSLNRPLAQLNFGATDYYAKPVTAAGFTVTNAADCIDLLSGEATGSATATFAPGAIPSKDIEFPVKGDIQNLAMSYVLVPTDNALVEVDFKANYGNEVVGRSFSNVPVQRNFRTNIYGNILTDPESSTTTITVSLK